MFSILIGIGIIYLVFRLFNSRNNGSGYHPTGYNPMYDQSRFGGAGNMIGGMILGYLLSRALINEQQYNLWQNLGTDELRQTLLSEGIVGNEEFDSLVERAGSEAPDLGDSGNPDSWTDNSGTDSNVNDSGNGFDDGGSGDGGFGGGDF